MIKEFKGEYRFLSNFWPVKIVHNNIEFLSVESAYQSSKSLEQKDWLLCSKLTPGLAKKFGKNLNLREDWELIKDNIMLDLLRKKFTNTYLKDLLLNTGDYKLEEGNYWGDTYWGICNGVGKNRLGVLLMQVREEIKNEL